MPRPKQQILVFSTDEVNLSVISFVLRIHGYTIHQASTQEDALDILESNDMLALLLIDPECSPNSARTIELQIWKLCPALATYRLDLTLKWRNALDEIRALAKRKRGPKPKKSVLREETACNLRKIA